MIATTDKGMYRPGQSLIHKLDPRIKIVAFLGAVVMIFAAGNWGQMAVLLAMTLAAALPVAAHAGLIFRVCAMLRWLLLFTFLMHLLFSSGRTLWGVSWLSFDGLLSGAFVCLQLVLALVVATTLALATSVDDMVGAFGWFVRPLAWLDCRTEEWQRILWLAFGFMPVVRDQIHLFGKGHEQSPECSPDRAGRWDTWNRSFMAFTERLLNKGDALAHEIAVEGAGAPGSLPSLVPLIPLGRHDLTFVAVTSLMVVCYWLAG